MSFIRFSKRKVLATDTPSSESLWDYFISQIVKSYSNRINTASDIRPYLYLIFEQGDSVYILKQEFDDMQYLFWELEQGYLREDVLVLESTAQVTDQPLLSGYIFTLPVKASIPQFIWERGLQLYEAPKWSEKPVTLRLSPEKLEWIKKDRLNQLERLGVPLATAVRIIARTKDLVEHHPQLNISPIAAFVGFMKQESMKEPATPPVSPPVSTSEKVMVSLELIAVRKDNPDPLTKVYAVEGRPPKASLEFVPSTKGLIIYNCTLNLWGEGKEGAGFHERAPPSI